MLFMQSGCTTVHSQYTPGGVFVIFALFAVTGFSPFRIPITFNSEYNTLN